MLELSRCMLGGSRRKQGTRRRYLAANAPERAGTELREALRVVELEDDPEGEYRAAAATLRGEVFGFSKGSTPDPGMYLGDACEQLKDSLRSRRARVERNRQERLEQLGLRLRSLAALLPAAGLANLRPMSDLPEGVHTATSICRELRTVDDVEVVGTLDIHVGRRLPGEFLEGKALQEQPWRRAYLFNVCSAPNARRLGVATHLMKRAHEEAEMMGALAGYVHVEGDNRGAAQLYESLGYEVEAREVKKGLFCWVAWVD